MAAKYKIMLRDIREATGKSAAQVAFELGVNPKTYSTWETGHTCLNADKIIRLSSYFGCTPNDLLGVTGPSAFVEASEDEARHIALLRALNPADRGMVTTLLARLAGS